MRIILLCTLFLAMLGTTLYQVKTSIDVHQNRLDLLQSQIAYTQREIAVLEAEWAFLSRPERVMDLSERLLGMRPIDKDRVLPLDAIPMRFIPQFKKTVQAPGTINLAGGDNAVIVQNLLSQTAGTTSMTASKLTEKSPEKSPEKLAKKLAKKLAMPTVPTGRRLADIRGQE